MKKLHERENEDKIYQMLMGLNDRYEPVRSEILRQDPLPSLDDIYAKLLNEEAQRQVSNVVAIQPENVAMMTRPTENVFRTGMKRNTGMLLKDHTLHKDGKVLLSNREAISKHIWLTHLWKFLWEATYMAMVMVKVGRLQ
ncbi:OLC1v1008618C1 [Oldenlandia corymbosa var. corymbosa]|uniref:OLC1v1008618C1 n=1 Tax=Oldenlandia corymbosa var. corymbosa TaxID=529605 RepID=A0AAV1DM42_OLDCO|nr:OLC1v1008618C1 [Oldenlandia corymbosa var. corymbosa]